MTPRQEMASDEDMLLGDPSMPLNLRLRDS
jgi:hypothetical protein